MPWANDIPATLLIENHGTAKAPRYKLGMFLRRTRISGETYLEPIPGSWAMAQLSFTDMEVVAPPGTKRDHTAGELSLTHTNSAMDPGGHSA